MRDLLRAGGSGVLLVLIMFVGSLVLWIGVPLGWLYVGSKVQGATDSLGTALAATMVGVVASIAALVMLLGWLNRKHVELREARGLESYGQTTLEGVMTISATIAIVGFGLWFFLFSGSSPLPLSLGY